MPTTFSEDEYGNLYVATITGNVFRILTNAVVPGDFQADANVDGLDLAIKQLALLISYGLFFALAAAILRVSEVSKMLTAMLGLAAFTAFAVRRFTACA